jgi:iron complex outermembrane receptor protein
MKKYLLLCTALVSVPALFGFASAANAQGKEGWGVSEIVVTAQKREQRLQDVPAAVTALTAESLQVSRVQNVADLDALSPNLTIQTVPSGSQVPVYSMRGVIGAATAPGSDRGVAVYIDGVYIGAGSGSIFNLADIERVEVLKGPQGTLFGRNSTGGAISFTTRGPAGRFAVKQDLTFGNYDQFRTRTRIDTPQWGPLSAAVTFTHSERRGETRNLGGGTVWDYSRVGGPSRLVSPNWLGNDDTEAWAASIRLDVSPDFDLVYKFDRTDQSLSEVGVGVTRVILPTLIALNAANPLPTRPSQTRPDAVNNSSLQTSRVEAEGHVLTASWRASDRITVKNIVAYRTNSYSSPGGQLDGLGGLFVAPNVPFVGIVTHSAGRDEQFSEEIQVDYDSDFMHLTTGGLWWRHSIEKGNYGTAANSDSFRSYPGFIVLPPTIPAYRSRITTKSKAAYAQGEFHVLDKLDVVVGGRYTQDIKFGLDLTIATAPDSIEYKKGEWTYNLGLNYKPTDDVLAYVKYSTGYISGGQLSTLEYQPEHAKSWEAGLKADWFDSRLRTNLAVFSAKYTGLQFGGTGTAFGVPQASQVLVNAGDAKAKGFELETTIMPVEHLTLGVNVGYLDFKYTTLDPRWVAAGNSLVAQRPEWTANFSAQYETPPVVGDARLNMRVDANFKAAHNGSANPTVRAVSYIPDVWLVNARIALQDVDLGGHKATLALWGRNLFDEDAIKYAIPLGVVVSASYEAGRTVGLDVTVEF